MIAVGLLALAVGVAAAIAAPAAAAPTPAAGNATPDWCDLNGDRFPERCEDGERITPTPKATPDVDSGGTRLSSQLVVLSAEMDGRDAVITLRSSEPQTITLTDAGIQALESGEEIPRVTQRVEGRATIRIRAHEVRGTRAVTIDSERAFAPVFVERGGGLDLGRTSVWTMIWAAFGGGAISLTSVYLGAKKWAEGEHEEVERVL